MTFMSLTDYISLNFRLMPNFDLLLMILQMF